MRSGRDVSHAPSNNLHRLLPNQQKKLTDSRNRGCGFLVQSHQRPTRQEAYRSNTVEAAAPFFSTLATRWPAKNTGLWRSEGRELCPEGAATKRLKEWVVGCNTGKWMPRTHAHKKSLAVCIQSCQLLSSNNARCAWYGPKYGPIPLTSAARRVATIYLPQGPYIGRVGCRCS